MELNRLRALVIAGALALAGGGASGVLVAQQGQSIAGFSRDAAATELGWEQKFRAIPEPDRVKANMKLLSAEPHHISSPYQKKNSEWLLQQFKSYGLDAKIEEFQVLFPTPVDRKVELVSPGPLRSEAEGACRSRRSDLGPDGPAAHL